MSCEVARGDDDFKKIHSAVEWIRTPLAPRPTMSQQPEVPADKQRPTMSQQPEVPADKEQRWRRLFESIDRDGDGVLSRIAFIKTINADPALAHEMHELLLGTPDKPIRQEDGTRDVFVKAFDEIDEDESGEISIDEFISYLRRTDARNDAAAADDDEDAEPSDTFSRYHVLHQRYQRADEAWEVSNDGDQAEMDDILSLLHRSSEDGDMYAQLFLGRIYGTGQGVPRDDSAARQWIRKSAHQGLAQAQAELAALYSSRRPPCQGVTKNDFIAVKWFRKAADQGCAMAQCSLGIMYEDGMGTGIPKSPSTAAEWYRKAADQGDPEAGYCLGVLLLTGGHDLEQDFKEGLRHIRQAHERGGGERIRRIHGDEMHGMMEELALSPEEELNRVLTMAE